MYQPLKPTFFSRFCCIKDNENSSTYFNLTPNKQHKNTERRNVTPANLRVYLTPAPGRHPATCSAQHKWKHKVLASRKRCPSTTPASFPVPSTLPPLTQPWPHVHNNLCSCLHSHTVTHHPTDWLLQQMCKLVGWPNGQIRSQMQLFTFCRQCFPLTPGARFLN